MKRWISILIVLTIVFTLNVQAKPIKWVDFAVPYESLDYAMDVDIDTANQEKHISWIDILTVAACRTGGKCGLASVKKAAKELSGDKTLQELLGNLYQYYDYYHEAYTAVLGGLLGNYAIQVDENGNRPMGLRPSVLLRQVTATAIVPISETAVLSDSTESTWVMT